ncbi:MAG TPA: hypothetical protein VF274_05470 [Alphaproteobacteria bacterium]|jgi:hypothetical protein
MPRRLALLAALFAAIAFVAPAALAADALEAFLHRWEDPRQFDPRDLDPDFRAEVNGGGQSIVLDRDQTIAYNERIRQILTSYTRRSFKILERRDGGDRVTVTYATAYEVGLRGQKVAVEETATVVLRRGGRSGFRVLSVTSHQRNLPG